MDKEAFLISLMQSEHLGDDGAIIGDTVYSADAFREGTHYRRKWMTPYQIGRKAMLVNLSDAVAMNADARYALVMLSIPKGMPEAEIGELTRGLKETASEYGCEIIGGDTVGQEISLLQSTPPQRFASLRNDCDAEMETLAPYRISSDDFTSIL